MNFTDDQRADMIGYSGYQTVDTPNLDRLARQGCWFRICFVNTSIWAVSRANLMTGQYPASPVPANLGLLSCQANPITGSA